MKNPYRIPLIENNVPSDKILYNDFPALRGKIRLGGLLSFGVEQRPRKDRAIAVIVVAGTHSPLLVVPVDNLDTPFMSRLRIKNPSPLFLPVMDRSAAVISADLPIFRDCYLIEEFCMCPLPQNFLKISQKKAVCRQYILRQKTIVLDHHRRIPKTGTPKRRIQILTVRPVIIKKQYSIVYFNMFFHFFSTSGVRYAFAFS